MRQWRMDQFGGLLQRSWSTFQGVSPNSIKYPSCRSSLPLPLTVWSRPSLHVCKDILRITTLHASWDIPTELRTVLIAYPRTAAALDWLLGAWCSRAVKDQETANMVTNCATTVSTPLSAWYILMLVFLAQFCITLVIPLSIAPFSYAPLAVWTTKSARMQTRNLTPE